MRDWCSICVFSLLFFFFSSRRRHTRYWRDWSSDVCSSDLDCRIAAARQRMMASSSNPAIAVRPAMKVIGGIVATPIRMKEIGRAACRERGEILVVAVSLKKKKKGITDIGH